MTDPPRMSLGHAVRNTDGPKGIRGRGREESSERRPRSFWTHSRKESIAAFFFILPDAIGLLVFVALPMVLVSTVSAVSGSQAFDLVYVMTKGGPANSTALAVFYIYQQAFQFNNYGYAAAMASSLVIVLMAMTIALFKATRGGRFYLT